MTVPGLGGRPLMFQSLSELEERIEKYFASCWEHYHVPIKDKDENIIRWEPQFDKDGNPLMQLKERPTITGLALALGTTRVTLIDYENRKNEFSDVVAWAKTVIEHYYEKGVAEGDIHPAVGIFALKNFKWTDIVQINTNTQPDQLTPDDIKRQLMEKKKGKAD